MPLHLVRLADALGLARGLAARAESESLFDRAKRALAGRDMGLLAPDLLVERARFARLAGDEDSSLVGFAAARDHYAEMGATFLAERVAAEISRT